MLAPQRQIDPVERTVSAKEVHDRSLGLAQKSQDLTEWEKDGMG